MPAGQATIPKAIREHLGLKSGDRVKFFMHPDGSVVLLPKRPASALRGIVKPRRRPATIEEMSEAAGAAADAGRRHARFGAKPSHFAAFGHALTWCLEQQFGEGFPPELRQAWTTLYEAVRIKMLMAPETTLAADHGPEGRQ